MAKFQSLYDKYFPLKKCKHSKNNKRKPWLNNYLKNLCTKRRHIFKQFILNPTLSNKLKYTKFRNLLNSKLRNAKSRYYLKKFDELKSDMTNMWKLINTLLKRNSKKSNLSTLKVNNNIITDNTQMANGLMA